MPLTVDDIHTIYDEESGGDQPPWIIVEQCRLAIGRRLIDEHFADISAEWLAFLRRAQRVSGRAMMYIRPDATPDAIVTLSDLGPAAISLFRDFMEMIHWLAGHWETLPYSDMLLGERPQEKFQEITTDVEELITVTSARYREAGRFPIPVEWFRVFVMFAGAAFRTVIGDERTERFTHALGEAIMILDRYRRVLADAQHMAKRGDMPES